MSCRSLVEAGLGSTLVGRVVGDNLLDRLETLSEAGVEFRNDSTGQPLRELPGSIRSIHVPLGAAPYVDAVGEGCRLIIGGSASPGALAMGFLHSDSLIDRSDWNYQATIRLHAMVAEQSSLALEMMATQNLVLQRAPWSPHGEDLQSLITRGLEQLEASGGITKLPLPDVSIQFEELSLVPGPYGGVTLTQVTGKPPSNDLPVEIIYPFGYETHLVAQFTQGDRFDEVDQLANQIKELFPLIADPMGHRGVAIQAREHSEQAVRSRVLEFHILEQEEATVAKMAGQVYELAAAVPGCQIPTPELPEIEVSLQRWTSTIPRDQVEWDVEIRAASHWA